MNESPAGFDVPAYALERGLIAAADVVDRRVAFVPAGGRHGATRVVFDGGRSQLVKHAAGDLADWLTREARMYALLGSEPAFAPLRAHVAPVARDDRERGVLVLDLLDGRSLAEHHAATGRRARWVGDGLGRILARLHAVGRDDVAAPEALPATTTPGILALPLGERAEDMSAGQYTLAEIADGQPELLARIDALRDGWRRTRPIHGDVRSGNVLVGPGRHLTLVDWEFAAWGDPLWDVGCAFADLLGDWIGSMVFPGARALLPLPKVRPAVQALWRAYGRADDGAADSAAAYCAARLIQLAFERLVDETTVGPVEEQLVILAANVAKRPAVAARDLLGL